MYSDQNDIPFYVGKGSGERHKLWGTRNGMVGCKIKSIGKENVKVYFLYKNLTEEQAFKHERYYISVFGRRDNGTGILTNHTDGGEGESGKIAWNKGVPMAEEQKKNISETCKGRPAWNKGIPRTEETKRKISKSHRGLPVWNKGLKIGPMLDEQKQKISKSMKRYKRN